MKQRIDENHPWVTDNAERDGLPIFGFFLWEGELKALNFEEL